MTTATTTTEPRTAPKASDEPENWQDQWFTMMKRIEQPVVSTTTRMATRLADVMSERPAFMASMPRVKPAMHDLVDAGLKFRERLVDEQARFARSMMNALDPMVGKLDVVHPSNPSDRAAAPTHGPAARAARERHLAAKRPARQAA